MSTIDPFHVLSKITDQVEDSEDKEWLQARLQFIIFSLAQETNQIYLDDGELSDDDDDDSDSTY